MILLQLSAGQGPAECGKAVGLALKAIINQCSKVGLRPSLVEALGMKEEGCYKSVLLQFNAKSACDEYKLSEQIADDWQGAMLWVCQSPFRPKHKRKNWFFSGRMFNVEEAALDKSIQFKACRASGAGGQHVNTTDSAIRATHIASGISVRVESERSQHANKRLARALLFQKLEADKLDKMTHQEQARWQQHLEVQRGDPRRVFKGEKFLS